MFEPTAKEGAVRKTETKSENWQKKARKSFLDAKTPSREAYMDFLSSKKASVSVFITIRYDVGGNGIGIGIGVGIGVGVRAGIRIIMTAERHVHDSTKHDEMVPA